MSDPTQPVLPTPVPAPVKSGIATFVQSLAAPLMTGLVMIGLFVAYDHYKTMAVKAPVPAVVSAARVYVGSRSSRFKEAQKGLLAGTIKNADQVTAGLGDEGQKFVVALDTYLKSVPVDSEGNFSNPRDVADVFGQIGEAMAR